MIVRELSEFFGAPVLVQFRDAIALAAAGAEKPYMELDEHGMPALVETPKGIVPRGRKIFEAIEKTELVGDEKLPRYTHLVRGRILPAPNERVYVVYETDGYIVKTALRPSDIVAVSSIEGTVNEEKRIVAS